MPGLHLFLKPNILFIHFILYFIFIFSLVILIPCLFLFHDCFYLFLFILFHDKDQRKINDGKREETCQIQYQHFIGHLPYRLLHVMVA